MRADGFGSVVLAQRQQLVAQREQAAWLEANDRNAARRERRVGLHQPVKLGSGLIDETRREEGAPAAEWTASAGRLRHMDAIAAFDQYAQRGVEILALVIAVEGVGEQHDLAAVGRAEGLGVHAERIAPERGQSALGADP